MDVGIGQVLDDRYTLIEEIGRGSMSTVYRARQHAMGRDVAVKLMRADAGSRERFLREARAHSRLGSPHTVSVLDFGAPDDGEPYLVMELLEGESLASRLARTGRFAHEDAVAVTRQILAALAEAHARGIVHRDLKPENLFFAREGNGQETLKVLDFGIAKFVRRSEPELSAPDTHVGTILGTPRYMSPEQARSAPVDARTDLYALGVVLYEMLVGRPPFVDRDCVVVLAHHVDTVPPAVRAVVPDVPIALDALVARLLEKDPDARPASADEVLRLLDRPPPVAPPKRLGWPVLGLLAVVALACGGTAFAVLARTAPSAHAAAAPTRVLVPSGGATAFTPSELPDALGEMTKRAPRRAHRKR